MAEPIESLRRAIGALLRNAKRAGAVRADVRLDEVLALLTRRTLAVVFDGRARAEETDVTLCASM